MNAEIKFVFITFVSVLIPVDKFRQVLIDKRTNVRYNYCIATLGKMLNSNSNKSVYGQFDFPFGWPLKYRRRKDARKIRSWLARFYY